ncbi:MAG: hypothetical protein JWN34_3004 [Bryobacterales bacterium]|nr:hypothetical protein [Bryobacterales bacterium]
MCALVKFQLHKVSFGVTGIKNGVLQTLRILPGAVLISKAPLDYSRKRVPMLWDGRPIEVFDEELKTCATQVHVPSTE